MSTNIALTGKERFFDKDEFIVSKTDLTGKIVYANRVFLEVAEYEEKDLLGKPHNIVRHPHMPRCIFKLLWQTLQSGKEIFAYINNKSKYGNNYWVFAHVTPSFDKNGKINGYHSNRRVPDRKVLENIIIPLYDKLLQEEKKHSTSNEGMEASIKMLNDILKEKGLTYDEFIFSL